MTIVDDDDDDEPCIVVCRGLPVCQLSGQEAVEAQQAGCPWCKRVWVNEDGTETIYDIAVQ